MWLLIIATTFYASGNSENPTIYQFQEFKTEKRCEEIKKWIVARDSDRIKSGRTTVQCIKND
jgi:hypothetical protein